MGGREVCRQGFGICHFITLRKSYRKIRVRVRTENLPYKFDLCKRFPVMRRLEALEGGAEFAAEKGGKFYLIRDGRTMAEMIPPDDEDLLDKMLTVLEFDSEDERNDYISRKKREKIENLLRYGKVISLKPFVPGWPKKESVSRSRRSKHKPEDGTSQRAVGMKADKTLHAIERARALLERHGLDLPPIPEELRRNFKERDRWCFSSRPVKIWPYEFDEYVKEAETKRLSDYVLLTHAGHGVNSYAIHYYVIRGPLRLFLQLAWGGIYEDQRKTTVAVNQCFKLADRLLELVETKGHRNLLPNDRMLIAASDFYGWRWLWSGNIEKKGHNKKPKELLKLVLKSLSKI